MEETFQAVNGIYNETKNFLIIGLTGRTGSGCTTAASKLSENSFAIPESYEGLTINEQKKHRIIKRYLDGEQWVPFYRIEARAIITYHLCLLDESSLNRFALNAAAQEMSKAAFEEFAETLRPLRADVRDIENLRIAGDLGDIGEVGRLYFERLPRLTEELKHLLGGARFTAFYQAAGDNIRASGTADVSDFNPLKIFNFSKHINYIIKVANKLSREKGLACRIVIDAIRNPYEAFYLKRRYANFYLMSINTSEAQRVKSLREVRKFELSDIERLDNKEYPHKLTGGGKFIAQNIQECIENSDIHIHNSKINPFVNNDLVGQLAWYLALMMHPGLVMPTSIENCMQIAYTAKKSSGCISRQVGAVVTDSGYSIKSVGWNSTPQGQTPCLLRNAEDLLRGANESDYSDYERNDHKFRKALSDKYSQVIFKSGSSNRNLSFCFKGVQNEIEGEKNQVHTRALHAEENAFLQIAKYGGQHLAGGVLFTTASPCELCAKKAYQLGISKIVYIDPYPGIATEHILSVGAQKPILELFRGAVGRAFYQLYQPLMPYKDELELMFDLPKFSDPLKPSREILKAENVELARKNKDLELKIEELERILKTRP
ncbi:hypothetical protein [Pseudomonas eucalypticola]|uniref:CMP/dCMP-type deaminase domain-containing protein n=1 Tax=Pseudomonas eucalypticola TaxID=2599595 RepID=A0A7D5H2C6_9PSED|nr:hypothetical protein [Pseudomonas eucalypticola]QKZ06427.1 hypothetical protein HWQ56_22665 [Pseudomonas eucalypticola]